MSSTGLSSTLGIYLVFTRCVAHWRTRASYSCHLQGGRLGVPTLFAHPLNAGTHLAADFSYRPGDWLLFGSETRGIAAAALADIRGSGGAVVRIPISRDHVRSINLAVAAGVGLFEAIRQLDSRPEEECKP